MPVLPVGSADSVMIWGSKDAGATVKNDDEQFAGSMGEAASELHLKAHRVAGTTICSAGDGKETSMFF